MNKKEVYQKALNTISNRKQNAIVTSNMHKSIIEKKIPEIANLQKLLSQSSIKLSKLVLTRSAKLEEVTKTIINDNLVVQARIKNLLQENGYPADYLDVNYHCAKCHDSGYIKGERCECLLNLVKQISISDFNETTYMSNCNFDDFSLSYYSNNDYTVSNISDYDIMSRILTFCKNYSKDFNVNSPSVLMCGATGLGKTHLSLSIAHEVNLKGFGVIYGTAYDFFTKIQNENFGKNQQGEDTFKTLMEADLVIIDDLGAEYDNAFTSATFFNIVNSRLNKSKPVIINTNLNAKEIATKYSERIASRLLTLYKCLNFVGKDIRQQKLK